MTHILSSIIDNKKKEVEHLPFTMPFSRQRKRSFVSAVIDNGIIAEIKPKSPSCGPLLSRKNVSQYVRIYDESAEAISVLCDEHFFGGSFDLLAQVRKQTERPILAKEFIVDIRQILQAKYHGADAVLLIASVLSGQDLTRMIRYAVHYGLDVLIEVHNKKECDVVIGVLAQLPKRYFKYLIVGINNRNLDTLRISLDTTKDLAPYLRKSLPLLRGIISESGITSHKETQSLSSYVDGFLIGTSILSSKHPREYLESLHPVKIKFCGMTNIEDIEQAETLNIDYIGLIFVSHSPRYVTLPEAKKLRKSIKEAKVVGVFGDMSAKDINSYVQELHLDYVQLHGEPSLVTARKVRSPVIQAFCGVPDKKTLQKYLNVVDYILIDKAHGAPLADFASITKLPRSARSRMFLAGGLRPENVQQAVRSIAPYAVDCASGIEKEGHPRQKSPRAMSSFIQSLQS